MSQYFLRVADKGGVETPIIGNNSEALSYADAVTIDSDGFITVASTSSKILGFCLETKTMASDNETVAKYCPLILPADGVTMVYTADQAVTQTDIGTYADLVTTTSGAQVLNLAGGATGQFIVVGFDPNNDGSTTLCIVKVAEPQVYAFAQS
jgi:hypothetical protein